MAKDAILVSKYLREQAATKQTASDSDRKFNTVAGKLLPSWNRQLVKSGKRS
jgi:hypothetical protein